jgi:hypothetical protein
MGIESYDSGRKGEAEKIRLPRDHLVMFFVMVVAAAVVVATVVIVMAEIYADVEAAVVPLGPMVAAPLAVGIHPGNVVIHLPAALAVAVGVAIDPGSIRIQAALAILLPVPIRASRACDSKNEAASHRACENQSTPESAAIHKCLLRSIPTLASYPFSCQP